MTPPDFLPRNTRVIVTLDGHEMTGRVRSDNGATIRVELHGFCALSFPREGVRLYG